jgi:hypothetical protein
MAPETSIKANGRRNIYETVIPIKQIKDDNTNLQHRPAK